MVQKYCKRGVYSGNTLRASNSLYRRRYAKQGCVVRTMLNQSSKASEVVCPNLLGVNADDVVFSLNKKGRWEFTMCIQKVISSNFSNKPSTKFVLIEKHKLKRQANCIGFYSNKGNTKKLVPRPGRYFSEKSILNCGIRSKNKKRKNQRATDVVEHNQELVPEVRYEIFYPCSTKSSIAHNPKYITSAVGLTEVGDNHPDEGKSRKKRGKKKRLRLSWKNVRDLVDDYDQEQEQDDDVSENDEDNDDDESYTDMRLCTISKSVCLSEFEINSAFGENRKSQKNAKRNNRCFNSVLDVKPRRIVYTDDNAGFDYHPKVTATKNLSVSKMPLLASPFSIPVIVNIPFVDTEPQVLRNNYGDNYYEASTIPRKFVIDISETVKDFVANSKFFKHINVSNFDFSSYLVFTHTGSQSDETFTFRVILNANLNVNTIGINTLFGSVLSVDDVIKRTLAFYCTIAEDMLVSKPSSCCKYASPLLVFQLVKSANNWYAEGVFSTWDKLPSEFTKNVSDKMTHCNQNTIYCEICFEQMDDDIRDGKPFTALRPCKHWFCDDCWRTYLLNSINSNLPNVKCPGYDCETTVDITTMLCFINIRDINHLRQYTLNNTVQASQNKKWCSYSDCGRLLVTSATNNDVTTAPSSMVCGCGTQLCFICMQPAHWPASCEQSKAYKEEIIKRGDYIHLRHHNEIFITEMFPFVKVQGKSCPRCCRFIEKDRGCQFMMCPCGTSFCWKCLQEWGVHNLAECYKAKEVDNTKHFILDFVDRDENTSTSNPVLYRLAMDRRLARHPHAVNKLRSGSIALVRSLNHLAAKDITTRTLIEENSTSLTIRTNVMNHLRHILRMMLGIKLEIDHVIEFTAVYLLNNKNKRNKQVLSLMISRLCDISQGFKTVFEAGNNQNVNGVLPRMIQLEKRASKVIATLRNVVHT